MTHIKNHLAALAPYLLGITVVAGLCLAALEVCVRGGVCMSAEKALPNNLPCWVESGVRVRNSEWLAERLANGGQTPKEDIKLATQLHYFIHEYGVLAPINRNCFYID